MSAPDLTSIPLPAGPSSAGGTVKKSAHENMKQVLLKDHTVVFNKEPAVLLDDASSKANTSSSSVITAAGLDGKASSQRIVDQLFKDFIAQKITSSSRVSKDMRDDRTVSRVRNSADEISKLLDMEIKSIQSSTESKEKLNDRKDQRSSTLVKPSKFIPVASSAKEGRRSSGDILSANSNIPSLSSENKGSVSLAKSSKFIPVTGSEKEDRSSGAVSSLNSDTSLSSQNKVSVSLAKASKFIPVTGSAQEGRRSSDVVLPQNNNTFSLGLQNKGSASSSENTTDAVCQLKANDNTPFLIPTTAGSVNTLTAGTASTTTAGSVNTLTSGTASTAAAGTVTTAASASTIQLKDCSQPQTGGSTSNLKRNVMLPVSLARKMMQPKVLGVKLSSESLSLITSKDRIDRDGRVWEEGEVCSSGSEASRKDKASESDGEGLPSDSGSIHSNSEEWKTQSSKHKKKHKHKHKKKRNKSSKEKDAEKDTRKSKDKEEKDKEKSENDQGNDKDTRSSKDKDDKKMEKDQTKEEGENHSKSKHRSTEQDHESKKKKKDSDRKRERSSSRSRSPKRRRKSKSKTRSRSKSPKRHRSRSRSSSPQIHGSGRYGEWDARRYGDDHSRFRTRSRSRSKERHRRSRDRSKSRERDESKDRDLRMKIDKARLRKIAIANALQNMKAGQGPQLDLTLVKSGGKSVEELTEFCKRISEKSKADNGTEDSSDEEAAKKSDEEDMLIHHPFKVKEASSTGIVMNIRNAKQLPVLTPAEKQVQQATLRLTFPVSSGSHHRASESEWVPVVKAGPATPMSQPAPTVQAPAVQAPAVQVPTVAEPQVPQKSENSIFPDVAEAQKLDIGAIISERLHAVRKLQENPYDMQALSKMHQVQQQASKWAASRHLPGQFVGSTGAHVLTQEQLIGDRRHQAWAKKTQLSQAAPVHGGIGMFLLQKMGWKQGEGLGKNNEGSKEPLMLDIKVDRRGLTTAAENPRHRAQAPAAAPRAKDLSNKHPVSALMELCNRRRWGPPLFTVVSESGPDHKKNFLFKVQVNNVEYQPASASSNKKLAKALCAAICLQEMGLLPRDAPLNI